MQINQINCLSSVHEYVRKYDGSVAFYTGVKHTYKLMQRVRPPSKSSENMEEGRLFWFREI